jgi:hypothetical protein
MGINGVLADDGSLGTWFLGIKHRGAEIIGVGAAASNNSMGITRHPASGGDLGTALLGITQSLAEIIGIVVAHAAARFSRLTMSCR